MLLKDLERANREGEEEEEREEERQSRSEESRDSIESPKRIVIRERVLSRTHTRAHAM